LEKAFKDAVETVNNQYTIQKLDEIILQEW